MRCQMPSTLYNIPPPSEIVFRQIFNSSQFKAKAKRSKVSATEKEEKREVKGTMEQSNPKWLLNSEKRNIHDKCIIYYHHIEIFPTQLFLMRVLHIVYNVTFRSKQSLARILHHFPYHFYSLSPFVALLLVVSSYFIQENIQYIMYGLRPFENTQIRFFFGFFHRYTKTTHNERRDVEKQRTMKNRFTLLTKNPSNQTNQICCWLFLSYSYSCISAVFWSVSDVWNAMIREREKQSKTKKMTSFCPSENGFSFLCFRLQFSYWLFERKHHFNSLPFTSDFFFFLSRCYELINLFEKLSHFANKTFAQNVGVSKNSILVNELLLGTRHWGCLSFLIFASFTRHCWFSDWWEMGKRENLLCHIYHSK